MKNSYQRGKAWDGKESTQMMITFNGETKGVELWANQLETSAETIRQKLKRVDCKLMSWAEAMANPDERRRFAKLREQKKQTNAGKVRDYVSRLDYETEFTNNEIADYVGASSNSISWVFTQMIQNSEIELLRKEPVSDEQHSGRRAVYKRLPKSNVTIDDHWNAFLYRGLKL